MACLRVWFRGILCGLLVLSVESAAACDYGAVADTGAELEELEEREEPGALGAPDTGFYPSTPGAEVGADPQAGDLAVDHDEDGYPVGRDCDDRRRAVHPGAPEACDGEDNDCNGMVDEGC